MAHNDCVGHRTAPPRARDASYAVSARELDVDVARVGHPGRHGSHSEVARFTENGKGTLELLGEDGSARPFAGYSLRTGKKDEFNDTTYIFYDIVILHISN